MKRKIVLIAAVLTFCVISASAFVDFLFPGWVDLEKESDVIVARCLRTPDPYNHYAPNGMYIDVSDGLIGSDMETVLTLKGTEKLGPIPLISTYWPHQGGYYLIFGRFSDGSFNAYSSYRVVSLGTGFDTNLASGRTLEEKVRSLLKYRLDLLNDELKQGQEEKKRLEEGLTGTNAASSVKTNGSRLNGK